MSIVATVHLWFASIFLLSTISMTLFILALKKKSQVLTNLTAKIVFITEMIFSGLTPLLGLWMIITQPFWMKFPNFHYKLTFAILSILLIHWSNAKLKKACKTGRSAFAFIIFLRVTALILLIVTYYLGTDLFDYVQM